ncbi:ligase-associated DNA damage response exonuclease [Orrella daihaiensis]|uniref:Ligase-associated DNA damage response exonuclease n=1 Tax=Orrella daihaiensis TaxID=2782176 RepID=A0ABY4AGF7_9BURK|nr:ligase-associated DNA damage response exonuclease [Orrella daihaiensis]UOD49386.1 ligase-associated DNA damage response exonuclease [Orrella daihaiensis]
MREDLVIRRPQGLYCPPGDFYIDPWRAVDRAIITHAHADHARIGHRHYLASAAGEQVIRTRLGEINLQTLAYGETIEHNGVQISLHPAGHVLGSVQVRLQWRDAVWVVSGDYKLDADPTCDPFEPVACDTFITESTFGLPVYRWPSPATVSQQINAWWADNASNNRASVLYAYSLGKGQRVLASIDTSIGPIITHGSLNALNDVYRAAGVNLPATQTASDVQAADRQRALVLAPPAAAGSSWMRRFGQTSDAMASGWMRVRGARRRRGVDRGFVMSDHADWPSLLRAIDATGASRVIVTHGNTAVLIRWLQEQGLDAQAFETDYGHEGDAHDE